MLERKPPTHYLVIRVPVSLDRVSSLPFDALKQVLHIALSASRAAYAEVICDDPNVELIRAGTPPSNLG